MVLLDFQINRFNEGVQGIVGRLAVDLLQVTDGIGEKGKSVVELRHQLRIARAAGLASVRQMASHSFQRKPVAAPSQRGEAVFLRQIQLIKYWLCVVYADFHFKMAILQSHRIHHRHIVGAHTPDHEKAIAATIKITAQPNVFCTASGEKKNNRNTINITWNITCNRCNIFLSTSTHNDFAR